MISPAWRVIQVSLQWSSAMVSSKNNSNLLEQSHLHKMARRIAQWCNQCSAIRVFSVMILCTSTMSWRHTPETNLEQMFSDVSQKICDTPKSTQIIPQNWSSHVHSNRILWLIIDAAPRWASQLRDLSWPFRLGRCGWSIDLPPNLTPPEYGFNKVFLRETNG